MSFVNAQIYFLSVGSGYAFSTHVVIVFLFFMAGHWHPLTHKDRSSFFLPL